MSYLESGMDGFPSANGQAYGRSSQGLILRRLLLINQGPNESKAHCLTSVTESTHPLITMVLP
jgi:hypothetical protein